MPLLSRNSSKTSSRTSIPDAINEINDEDNINTTIYLTDNELNSLMNNRTEEVSHTMTNPLGRLLLQLGASHNKLMEINNPNNPNNLMNLSDMCKSFQEGVRLNKDEIYTSIKNSSNLLKRDLYHRELNYHLQNPLIKAPDYFSPEDTLTTPQKVIDAARLFPQHNKQKFSGEGDPPIAEFIYLVNSAQARLKLSENEFKQRLLLCTTGGAHKLLRNLVTEGDQIDSIYHKLMVLYDSTVSPETAKSELLKFKIHKKSTLMRAQAKILELSAASARIFPEGPLRKAYSNSEACTALIRSLPPKSSTLVASQYNVMIAKQPDGSHGPLFTEMILYLNPYRAQIDADITENGVSTDAFASRTKLQVPLRSLRADTNMAPRYNNRFQAYRNDRFTDNLQVNNINTNSEGYQPRYQPRPSTSRGGPRNKYLNTMYCSLCSGTSHTAAMGCYKIKDDSGKSILISPTQIPCNICEKVLQKKLFHPVKFCFNRKATATGSYEKTNRF